MSDEQNRKQDDHRHASALRILENETQWQLQPVASSQESLHLLTNRDKGGSTRRSCCLVRKAQRFVHGVRLFKLRALR
jgi:hypothetical protein